jgi:triosephosphate isomerase
LFIINFKNYEEIAGVKSLLLAKTASIIANKHKLRIMVCPPQHLMSEVARVSKNVLAQHLDTFKMGSTTGYVIPEMVKKSQILGSLINHSEHRIPAQDIESLVVRLRELHMKSIVCVQDLIEVERFAKLNPDYIAIEPPELIGSGKAVSKERPGLITESVEAVLEGSKSTQLLCGAGIVSGEDVNKALELGAKGILVASGIVKAKNWKKIIEEFSIAFKKSKV